MRMGIMGPLPPSPHHNPFNNSHPIARTVVFLYAPSSLSHSLAVRTWGLKFPSCSSWNEWYVKISFPWMG